MSNEKSDDIEAALMYPSMEENPQLRWAFIRKVYTILAVQLIATIVVAAFVADHQSIALFFGTTWAGWAIYAVILISVFMVICLLSALQHKHPINFILLGIFTLFMGLLVGLAVSFVSAMIVIEAAAATLAVVVCLTLYTFWAARRGEDFSFLVPFVITVVVTLVLLVIFQIFFPLGKISTMLYNGLFILLLCAYIIIDTDNLIKRNKYEQYIWASITLYFDILNMFLKFLRALISANRRQRN
ncbi:protein LIFEGUARD 3-like [Salvia hispanica]|uniref:protein LIFEGUARD 3-like n=1 Tax=Salvia hispanica TaxID=49212 RepID=UPI002009D603|nr:protein LIFEGUARD 3-like [Salvia hispanica]